MSITAEQILAAVKSRTNRTAETSASIENEVCDALQFISRAEAFIMNEDTSQGLAASAYTLDEPDDFGCIGEGGGVFVYLDGEVDVPALPKMDFTFPAEYSEGRPQAYELFNDNGTDKIRVWPAADEAYLVLIRYGKIHPYSTASILLPDRCRQALYWKASEFVARVNRQIELAEYCETQYIKEMNEIRRKLPSKPRTTSPHGWVF